MQRISCFDVGRRLEKREQRGEDFFCEYRLSAPHSNHSDFVTDYQTGFRASDLPLARGWAQTHKTDAHTTFNPFSTIIVRSP